MNMKLAIPLVKALVLTALVCLVAGCNNQSSPQQTTGTNVSIPPKKVTVILSWSPSAEHAFLYQGMKQGIFRSNGLDVIVQPSKGSSEVAKALEGGTADFGFISGDSLVMARIKGIRLRALSTLFHNSPVTIYSLTNAGITKPEALKGKRVGVIKTSTTYKQYLLFLKKEGIDPDSIVEVPSSGSPQELISGNIQAGMQYSQYAPVMLRSQGYAVNEILLKDHGVDIVSTSLATTDEIIKRKPQMVQAFVTAFQRSLDASRGDPEGALKALIEAEPSLNPDSTRASLQRVNEMMFTPEALKRGAGYLSLDDWDRTQKTLKEGEQIDLIINPQYFFDDNFFNAYRAGGHP
jgi:NitT/TauT family transport system substrate-binding protein